ncbi:MAG TPA: arginine--tRNA ligase, partial [Thermoanaerobaculia bacterium]|nr:arginine--tRNA ligase [Thermoanaerobaculia bacterium]
MILEQITEQLTETLTSRVLTLFGHAIERVVLQAPPRLAMGDLATPVCLELAKALKRKPRELAEALVDGLHLPMFVQSVTIEGAGYLNFRLDRGAFTAAHIRSVMAPASPTGERVIVEHTNINPNKAAHIGHLRNSVLGDTLVRCMKWLGYRVETQNYIDDTGVQVADVVVAFRHLEPKSLAEVKAMIDDPGVRFDYYCWDVYSKMAS